MSNKKGSKKVIIMLSDEELDLFKKDMKLRRVYRHGYIIALFEYKYEQCKIDDIYCTVYSKEIYKGIERNNKLIFYVDENEIKMLKELERYIPYVTHVIYDYFYNNKECIKHDYEEGIYYEDDITEFDY